MSESLDEQLYRYPGSPVLRNKFDLRDAEELNRLERLLVSQRTREGLPQGRFDLPHLQAIHHHLFQDVYEWAGEIRRVPLQKGESVFMPPSRIELAMQDVHSRLQKANHLKGLSRRDFAHHAGTIVGDINLVHPFREGNGRTQLQYLKQLGEHAGHTIDLTRIERRAWITASIAANRADPDYSFMRNCIRTADPDLSRSVDRGR